MSGNLCFPGFYFLYKIFSRRYLRDPTFLESADKRKGPVYQVCQVSYQFSVDLFLKIVPGKNRIGAFGAIVKNIKAPHVCRDAGILCVVSKDSDPLTFRKLPALVVQILG